MKKWWVNFRFWLIRRVVGNYGVVMNVKINQFQRLPVIEAVSDNTLIADCTHVTDPLTSAWVYGKEKSE